MTRKKQNYELSLFKFIFSIIIVLYHSHRFFSNDTTYILGSGWSGTEFFFIVSGYLMAVSSRKYSEKPLGASTFDFIMKKIKSIYPFYIIAFLLTFAVRQFAFSLKRDLYIFEDFLISINEMLLLQDSGITFKRIYNGPTWYISAMIIAMMVLFPLLLKFKEWYTNIGGLTISVFIYAYIAQNVYSVNNAVTWLNITTVGILRAIAALSLGAFLYGLVNRIKERNFAFTKSGKTLMLLSELGAFILLIWIMQNLRSLNGKYQFDFIMIILIFYILIFYILIFIIVFFLYYYIISIFFKLNNFFFILSPLICFHLHIFEHGSG